MNHYITISIFAVAAIFFLSNFSMVYANGSDDCVILLHGLCRSESSMKKLEKYLQEKGYFVINQGYPSRKKSVEALAGETIPKALKKCPQDRSSKIHFVTHSMGGILVRYYLAHHNIDRLGNVVMLSPPNHGSEVVDRLKNFKPFQWLNGPAGNQLGTDKGSIVHQLGLPEYPVGIITGDRSINLILSLMIPGKDDGKVSIKSAQLENMTDFLVVHASHPMIMKKKTVMYQVEYFLRNKVFDHKKPDHKPARKK